MIDVKGTRNLVKEIASRVSGKRSVKPHICRAENVRGHAVYLYEEVSTQGKIQKSQWQAILSILQYPILSTTSITQAYWMVSKN